MKLKYWTYIFLRSFLIKPNYYNFFRRWSLNQFVNNEDVRKLFIYVRPPRQLVASLQPPYDLKSKNIFFMKTNVGVKLTKENIGKISSPQHVEKWCLKHQCFPYNFRFRSDVHGLRRQRVAAPWHVDPWNISASFVFRFTPRLAKWCQCRQSDGPSSSSHVTSRDYSRPHRG